MWSSVVPVPRRNKQIINIGWSPPKMFLAILCCTVAIVGSQFVFLNSYALIWFLWSSLKQNLIHLLWYNGYFPQFLIFKRNYVKELHNILCNSGFTNLFCLHKCHSFALIFFWDTSAMEIPHKLELRLHSRYSARFYWREYILFCLQQSEQM